MTLATATDSFSQPEFLDRLRARDEGAMQMLVHAYLPQILRAARGAGLSDQNAEDVGQSTFFTFIEKIAEFEGRSHIRTWLFGILYRKISEMRRSDRREASAEDIDGVVESRFRTNGMWAQPPRNADHGVWGREVRQHLNDCLEDVPTDQRMAFLLREVEEMNSDEICRTMAVSRSNLGVLLYRGRNRLRECLENKNIKGS